MKTRHSLTLTSLVGASLLSPLAMAHPGHDHQHWTASLLHLLWLLPAITAVVVAMILYRRHKVASNQTRT